MTGRRTLGFAIGLVLAAAMDLSPQASAQAPAADSIAEIDADFEREALKLAKVRLERLGKLASSKTGAEADRVYEAYFRLAISADLYAEAEATSEAVMKSTKVAPEVSLLAHLVNIVAEANRGAFTESQASLETALDGFKEGEVRPLPVALKLSLLDAYLQRLEQGGHFDIALQVLRRIGEKSADPAVQALAARRSKQFDLVGKTAPPIVGTDVDGKPYNLADHRGEVVLVVFWATWCQPSALEVAAFKKAYQEYQPKGLRVVGVNVDSHQSDAPSADTVEAAVKRFLIDHNVSWPNLIAKPGEGDPAALYGVTDVPSNVLVGRDGKIVQLDLTRANLNRVLAREVGK